jgi:hypothetical protein
VNSNIEYVLPNFNDG